MRWLVLGLLCFACTSEGTSKPTGTPTDPVEHCEEHGQVCRVSKSQLGVCIEKQDRRPEDCGGKFPCLACAPQH